MNTKIDIKSAAMGLMLGVLIMLCVAATTSTGNPVGRYQAVTSVNNGGIGGDMQFGDRHDDRKGLDRIFDTERPDRRDVLQGEKQRGMRPVGGAAVRV
jgi:hypothetical protein